MSDRIDAIRARLRADRDARIDTPDGEPRCALCDGEGTGETIARRTLLEYAPADLAALCDEVERLRAIIAGRDRAPTDAEIEAHAVADGSWLHADAEDDATTVCQSAWETRLVRCRPGRWWALGPDKRVCAWPVVTEVTP